MNRDALASHARAMASAIAESLRLSRDHYGVCRFCRVVLGQQHRRDCALWPIIVARAAYSREREPGPLLAENRPPPLPSRDAAK